MAAPKVAKKNGTKAATKTEKPLRTRVMKSNASIPAAIKKIAKECGLPASSIQLVYPSGRAARSDATIGTLRAQWEKASS